MAQEVWTLLLPSVLVGKAREVYSSMSVEQSAQYELIKSAILKAYELVPEAYQQHFRSSKKKDVQTFTEFAREKEVQFDGWCTAMEVAQDYNKLRQLILLEQFKSCLQPHIKTYLDERKANNLAQAAVFADDYSLTHKSTFSKSDTEPVEGGLILLEDNLTYKVLILDMAIQTNPTQKVHDHQDQVFQYVCTVSEKAILLQNAGS